MTNFLCNDEIDQKGINAIPILMSHTSARKVHNNVMIPSLSARKVLNSREDWRNRMPQVHKEVKNFGLR
jgi:hypothetical protein